MASLKADSTLASSPLSTDNSTKIATTAFVKDQLLENVATFEFIRYATLINSTSAFPVLDTDFDTYSTIIMVCNNNIVAESAQSFKWTCPVTLTKYTRSTNTSTTTTSVDFWNKYPLIVTKINATRNYNFKYRDATDDTFVVFNTSGTDFTLASLVASSFNSLSGEEVNVYGMRSAIGLTF